MKTNGNSREPLFVPAISLFLIPAVLLLVFTFTTRIYIKDSPVSYWDEMLWIGKSYFFDIFIKGDFQNQVWQSRESYDQPKLAEYLYGAWLYPDFLKEKNRRNEQGFDYTKFLILNGFYQIDEGVPGSYKKYRELYLPTLVQFKEEDSGFPEEYVAKYGSESLKTINLIYKARQVNTLLISFAALVVYYIVYIHSGSLAAVVASFLYGFNTLLITVGLRVYSEALFVFLFNGSLLFMILFFLYKNKPLYLILFSIFAGLCISTKLNGAMLLGIFVLVSCWNIYFGNDKIGLKKLIIQVFTPIIVSAFIFVLLNPFVHDSPASKIGRMYKYRFETATQQADGYPEWALPNPVSRLTQIYRNFFDNDSSFKFNGLYFFSLHPYPVRFFLVLFVGGLISEIIHALKGNKISAIVFVAFIGVLVLMSYYLKLNWDRYYVQFVFFVVWYQSIGLFFYIKTAKTLTARLHFGSGDTRRKKRSREPQFVKSTR